MNDPVYHDHWGGHEDAAALALRTLQSRVQEASDEEDSIHGAGDWIAAATRWFGIKQCSGCSDRRAWLNNVFAAVPRNVQSWAVGVITAPRVKSLLTRSLASLAGAGWGRPVVFAEPGLYIPGEVWELFAVEQSRELLRPWRNWYRALRHLIDTNPHADAVMIAQDDVLYCRGLRWFLERELWPTDRLACVTPYRSAIYSAPEARVSPDRDGAFVVPLEVLRPNKPFRGLAGACCLIFPRQRAVELVESPLARNWVGPHYIDRAVAEWSMSVGRRIWTWTPSLAEHIGEGYSTCHHGGGGFMAARDWPGEGYDVNRNRADWPKEKRCRI